MNKVYKTFYSFIKKTQVVTSELGNRVHGNREISKKGFLFLVSASIFLLASSNTSAMRVVGVHGGYEDVGYTLFDGTNVAFNGRSGYVASGTDYRSIWQDFKNSSFGALP